MPTRHHIPLAFLLCLLAGGLLRHYGPALWVAGKRWIGRRIFGSK